MDLMPLQRKVASRTAAVKGSPGPTGLALARTSTLPIVLAPGGSVPVEASAPTCPALAHWNAASSSFLEAWRSCRQTGRSGLAQSIQGDRVDIFSAGSTCTTYSTQQTAEIAAKGRCRRKHAVNFDDSLVPGLQKPSTTLHNRRRQESALKKRVQTRYFVLSTKRCHTRCFYSTARQQ